MKSTIKTVLITIVVVLVFGIIAISIVGGILNINISLFGTPAYIETTHELTDDFNNIEVFEIDGDIRIYMTTEDTAKVISYESQKIYNSVKVENNTLKIIQEDDRNWIEQLRYNLAEDIAIKIYLPYKEYNSLMLKTVSGDINISDRFNFEDVEISTTSGEVYFGADVSYDIYVESISGDISLGASKADNVEINSTSGEVDIFSVTAQNIITVDTVSGDININASDASSLDINSVSGEIDAMLLTNKDYHINTTSGSVRVPESDRSAGRCNASTVSGDIKIGVH